MSAKLRQNAEQRLQTGTAPVTRGWPTGIPALTLLHRLSSSPDSASDALKLLHELQVYQVELDLQHEQADEERRQLSEDLANGAAVFELAPFAYLTLNSDGVVIAANRIAADSLGQEITGCRIEDLLAPACRATLQGMLAALRGGSGRHSCAVQFKLGGASANAVANLTPDGAQVLLAFVPQNVEKTQTPAQQSPWAAG